jgi:hypothetical protein
MEVNMKLSDDAIQFFVLNGKRYGFNRVQVSEAVRNRDPRRIDKYSVEVDGVHFPPKQVVELLTGIEPINFTTMDAQRILKRLGYLSSVASRAKGQSEEDRTLSEQYFEYYLRTNGYSGIEFEPQLPETSRRPDYRVTVGDKGILLEVKEFQASDKDLNGFPNVNGIRGGAYDPYAPIRQKIDDAREKFKGIKEKTCCLVLFNENKPLVDLNWQIVYGAMLGPIAVSIPFNSETEAFDHLQSKDVFNGNGKCGPRHNTKISAVIVLEPLLLGERRFRCHINKLRREMGDRKLSWEEVFELERTERDRARGTDRDASIIQWRVVILENPWAPNQLDRGLFCGRFDERYGDRDQDGTIQRIFAGEAVEEIEMLEREHPPIIRSAVHRFMDR